jgi:hypothetical protein
MSSYLKQLDGALQPRSFVDADLAVHAGARDEWLLVAVWEAVT